jgi:hypothetical protein
MPLNGGANTDPRSSAFKRPCWLLAHVNRFEINAVFGKNPVLMTDRNDAGIDGDRSQSDANFFFRLRRTKPRQK